MMRNLYRACRGNPQTEAHILQQQIRDVEHPDVRADCEVVLGDPKRRKVYDAVWTAMTDIGILRTNLMLEQNPPFPSQFRMSSSQMRSVDDFAESVAQHEGKRGQASSNVLLGWFISFVFSLFKAFGNGLLRVASLIIIIIPIGIIGVIMDNCDKNDSKPYSNRSSAPTSYAPRPPSLPSQPLPRSGEINTHIPGVYGSMDAPFEIKTSAGSNYLLKMEHWDSGRDILDVFVRSGETIEIKVPVGKYRVKYASGQTWYGSEELFGPRTSYSKADQPFEFRKTYNGYNGYTITLYRVRNGNLRTSNIGASDF